MKRKEMSNIIQSVFARKCGAMKFPCVVDELCDDILEAIEEAGMAPPQVDVETRHAIMSVYYGGYTFHQWDEDVEQNEKVQAAKKRRAEAKQNRLKKKIQNGRSTDRKEE